MGKSLPIEMTTVDQKTGKRETTTIEMGLMAPIDPDACPECGVVHEAILPHHFESLYYQYSFFAEHGRWPTWHDAMAHCSDEIKEVVAGVLDRSGIDWRGGQSS